MGSHKNIDIDTFPKQGTYLNHRVRVCFNYDASKTIEGVVVRDDEDSPGELIIKLDDDRYVRSVECMWQPLREENK